jgi:hypothetical protein
MVWTAAIDPYGSSTSVVSVWSRPLSVLPNCYPNITRLISVMDYRLGRDLVFRKQRITIGSTDIGSVGLKFSFVKENRA